MNCKQLLNGFMAAMLMTASAVLPVNAEQSDENIETIKGEAAAYQAGSDLMGTNEVTDASSFELPIQVQFCQTEARSELAMINELRTGEDAWYWNEDDTEKVVLNDLEEIRYDYDLEKVAMQRAVEVAVYYSHTRPDGNSCWQTYDDLGYSWMAVGENIAAGYRTAAAVFTGWAEENEPYDGQGHRRNMLSAKYKAVGCACVYYEGYYYWVQNFSGAVVNATETPANDGYSIEKAKISNSNAGTWSVSPESLDILVHRPYTLSEQISVNYKLAVSGWSPQTRERKSAFVPDWKAEDETVLQIENGVMTGLKKGTSKITGASPDGSSTLAETVNVDCIFINSASVALDEKIQARIYIYVPEAELDTTYVATMFNGMIITAPANSLDKVTKDGRECLLIIVGTYAKQMRDGIKITVKDKEGTLKYLEYKGTDVTDGFIFSVSDYVKLAEDNSDDALLIDLVHKMNWYGLYAQKQFSYYPVEFEEPAEITNFNDTVLNDYAVQNTGTANGITYTSGSLQLDSDTGVRVYYTLTGTDSISDYTFTVDGTEVQPALRSGKKYYVTINGMAAKDLNAVHTITVTDKAGNVLTTKYSGLSYAYAVVSNANAPDTLKDLCRSIYLYWEAAYNYFPSNNK